MDGAASIITVISLALSSSQAIYKTVSGFKNAPQIVQRTLTYLFDLSNILRRLKENSDRLYSATSLSQLITKCAQTLQWFEAKLAKLSPITSKRVERLWKNIKAMLQEKNLNRMAALLQQHISALSFEMQYLNR